MTRSISSEDAPPGPSAEEENRRLRREGERVEALLDELDSMVGPQARPRLQEVMHRVTSLYGTAFARILELARASQDDGRALDDRLCGDELVASLLLVHGLHPRTPRERVQDALDAARPLLADRDLEVELLEADAERVRIRVEGKRGGARGAPGEIERLVREVAPEVSRVVVEDTSPEQLVQLHVGRPAGREP